MEFAEFHVHRSTTATNNADSRRGGSRRLRSPQEARKARTLRLDAANQTAARLLTYGLRYVKDSFKNTSSLDVATLATLAGEKGMGVGPIPETNEIGCLRGRVVDVVRVEA